MLRTRVPVVAAAVLLAAPLLTGTAAAADPVTSEGLVVVADKDLDGSYGVYRQAGGTESTVLVEDVNLFVSEVTSSRDGSRFAYVQTRTSADGETYTQQVVVRDASGALVRALDVHTVLPTTAEVAEDVHPALSPDGSELVWTQFRDTETTSTVRLLRADLATGAVTEVAGSADHLAWVYLTPTLLMSIDATTEDDLVTLSLVDGSSTTVAGLSAANDGEFTVSPSGSKIVWTHLVDDTTTEIRIGDLAVVDSVATVSNPVALSSTLLNNGPTFSADGATVRFTKRTAGDPENPSASDAGDVWTVPAAGGTATQTATSADELVAAPLAFDSTAPTATVATQPFRLAGTSAVLFWTVTGTDADLSGVRITRTGGTATKTVVVPVSQSSYQDSGLTVGATYTYELAAVDRSGNAGPAVTRQLTAIQPFTTFPDPTSTGYFRTPAFRVGLPAQGTKRVDVRTNGTGPLVTWVTTTASSAVFSAARAGYSYGFLVTVTDGFGNSSAPTGGGTAVVPYDQTRATYSGAVLTQRSSDRYLGSATLLRAAGAAMRMTVNGNRLQVVGERCASCGVMDVYVDGRRVAGVDTRAAARQVRQVLFTRALGAGNHAVVIKARGTAGRPNVVLDGLAVRH